MSTCVTLTEMLDAAIVPIFKGDSVCTPTLSALFHSQNPAQPKAMVDSASETHHDLAPGRAAATVIPEILQPSVQQVAWG